jgi:hypothetical protein
MNEETYCVLPYNHLSISPTGEIRPCCNYNIHTQEFRDTDWQFLNVLDIKNLEDLLGAKPHVELRKDIACGHKHSFCDRCWVVEDGGGTSYRNNWNDHFDAQTPEKFQREVSIKYLEMTLGNKCNIQCRMCNPWSSNMWASDIIKHPELDSIWHTRDKIGAQNFEWYNDPNFDNLMEQIIPTLEHLNMLGGEPLFNSKYYEILQLIIDSDRADQISLQFNTNMLSIQDKVFPMWEKFKSVSINMSCDGVGAVNEYVRWPGKWSKWERNLIRAIELQKSMGTIGYKQKLQLQVHSTMSSLTWLDLGNLYAYTKEVPIEFNLPFLIQVNQPAYMDAIHLPEDIKQQGYDQAMVGINNSEAAQWSKDNNKSLLDHVMNTTANPELWNTFIIETNKLDKVRNSSILDVVPEYKKYWHYDSE